jgi:hypothetical protein
MTELTFRKVFRVVGKFDHGLKRDVTFRLSVDGYGPVEASIATTGDVTATWCRPVSTQFAAALERNVGDLDEFRDEARSISATIGGAISRLVRTIKYAAHHTELDKTISSAQIGVEWLDPQGQWRKAFEGDLSAVFMGARSVLPIDDPETVSGIQALLDSNFQPLEALRHLHRAERESDPRSKWIEATIAAELAVKEVLMRLHPNLSTLLLELPAPPIDKLYGKVLETYSGKSSEFKTRLAEGAKVRNQLLHRPGTSVEFEKARDYIAMVRKAIYDLVVRLDPEDEFARFFRFGPPKPGCRPSDR